MRRAIVFHPLSIAGAGLLLATLSGLVSMLFHVPFMTGLWVYPVVFGYEIPLSSVMTFDYRRLSGRGGRGNVHRAVA